MPFHIIPKSLFRRVRPAVPPSREVLLPPNSRPLSGLSPAFEDSEFEEFEPCDCGSCWGHRPRLGHNDLPPVSLTSRPPAQSANGIISMPHRQIFVPQTQLPLDGNTSVEGRTLSAISVTDSILRDLEQTMAESVEFEAEFEERAAESRRRMVALEREALASLTSPHVYWAAEAEAWAEARRRWWSGEDEDMGEDDSQEMSSWIEGERDEEDEEEEDQEAEWDLMEEISMLDLPEAEHPEHQGQSRRTRNVVRSESLGSASMSMSESEPEVLFDALSPEAEEGDSSEGGVSPLEFPSTESSFDMIRGPPHQGPRPGLARPLWACDTNETQTIHEALPLMDNEIPVETKIGLQRALVPPPLPPRAPNHHLLNGSSKQILPQPGRFRPPTPNPGGRSLSSPVWWENLPRTFDRGIKRQNVPPNINTTLRKPSQPKPQPKPAWADFFTASPASYTPSELSSWDDSSSFLSHSDIDTDTDSPWNPPGLNIPRGGYSFLGGAEFSLDSLHDSFNDELGSWSPPGHRFRRMDQATILPSPGPGLGPGPYSGNIIEPPRAPPMNLQPAAAMLSPTAIPGRPKTAGKEKPSSSRKRQLPFTPPPPVAALPALHCAGGCGRAFLEVQSPSGWNGKKRQVVCSDCDSNNGVFRPACDIEYGGKRDNIEPASKRHIAQSPPSKVRAECGVM